MKSAQSKAKAYRHFGLCLVICCFSIISLASLSPYGSKQALAQDQSNATANTAGNQTDISSETTQDTDETEAQLDQRIGQWNLTLDQIQSTLRRTDVDEERLAEMQKQLSDITLEISPLHLELQPQSQQLRERLEAFSAKEGEQAPELDDNAKAEQAEITKELGRIESQISLLKSMDLRIQDLSEALDSYKRRALTDRLGRRSSSLLSPFLWSEALAEFPSILKSMNLLLNDWFSIISKRVSLAGGLLFIGGVILFMSLVFVTYRYCISRLVAMSKGQMSDMAKSAIAVSVALAHLIVPVLLVLLIRGYMVSFNIYPPLVVNTFEPLFSGVITLSVYVGLVVAIFAPNIPERQLVPLDRQSGKSLRLYVIIAALIDIIHEVLMSFVVSVDSLSGYIDFSHGLVAGLQVMLLILGLRALYHGLPQVNQSQATFSERIWRLLIPIYWMLSAVVIFSLLIGYIMLADFIVEFIFWSAAVLGTTFLLSRLVEEIIKVAINPEGQFGRFLAENSGLASSSLAQAGAVIHGVVRVTILFFATIWILIPFNLDSLDFSQAMHSIFFGFEIADITISLSQILLALLILVVGVLITGAVQNWLSTRYLPLTSLDIGIKNSIKTSVTYLGYILAGFIAFSYLGVNLERVAIVAGALSVGIGFGLQNVVNNFISGLLLLAERPIKAGDWIVVGSEQGYVKNINVRATEIETFDKATVIIPNSELIGGTVKNWMHHNNFGRIILPVGVGYNSDPDQVRDILIDVANSHERVSSINPPSVYFMDFGDSALLFELRCYLDDIDWSLSAKSEMRFEIMRRFKAAGIEIPFPQRDVYVRYPEKENG